MSDQVGTIGIGHCAGAVRVSRYLARLWNCTPLNVQLTNSMISADENEWPGFMSPGIRNGNPYSDAVFTVKDVGTLIHHTNRTADTKHIFDSP